MTARKNEWVNNLIIIIKEHLLLEEEFKAYKLTERLNMLGFMTNIEDIKRELWNETTFKNS